MTTTHHTDTQAGKTRVAHGRPFRLTSLWPATHATPRHTLCCLAWVDASARLAFYIFAALLLFAQMRIRVCLNMGSAGFFFFLFSFSFSPCTSVFSAVLASLSPPSSTFIPSGPPLAVGCGGDNHQAARVRADTHQRLRPDRSQREICSRACQESLCCQG